jgi:hypothetical protein
MTGLLIAGAALAIPLLMLHASTLELERADKIVKARQHTTE